MVGHTLQNHSAPNHGKDGLWMVLGGISGIDSLVRIVTLCLVGWSECKKVFVSAGKKLARNTIFAFLDKKI